MTETSRGNYFKPIAWTAILLLSALSAFLAYDRTQQSAIIDQKTAELDETSELYASLDVEFTEAKSELDALKSDNTTLNALINTQMAELDAQKSKISRLIRVNKDLESAREELAQLRQRVSGYLQQIDQLRGQNSSLVQKNFQLEQSNKSLHVQIDSASQINRELMSARAVLATQKEELTAERDMLSNKVTRASVISVHDLEVQGYKIRNSGKLAKKDKARKVDMLQVCFTTDQNFVSDLEEETFYIRIINPIGETLYIESLGSGKITLEEDEELRYTQSTTIPWEQERVAECITWKPEIPFQKGEYQLEIYNKGFPAGSSTFKLH